MKIRKTKTVISYKIDYENGVSCLVTVDKNVSYRFKKNGKNLTVITDEVREKLENTHWSNHFESIPSIKMTLDELKDFRDFDKLMYVGGGIDGMLADADMNFISTPVRFDDTFCKVWYKIKSKNVKEYIELLSPFIPGLEEVEIPYYNGGGQTLSFTYKFDQETFDQCMGDSKYLDDMVKIKLLDTLTGKNRIGKYVK